MIDFGLRLRKLREQRGWTQQTLAKRINRSTAAVSSYELGRQMPPADVLISLSVEFGMTVDELVGQTHRKSYVVDNLTDPQKVLLELLFTEFSEPTRINEGLSPQQILIIQRLFHIFES